MIRYSPKEPTAYGKIDERLLEPHAWNLAWLSEDLAVLPCVNNRFVGCIARSLDAWLPVATGREQVWELMEVDSTECMTGVSALYIAGLLKSFPLYEAGGDRWLRLFNRRARGYSQGAPTPPNHSRPYVQLGPLIDKFMPHGYRGEIP